MILTHIFISVTIVTRKITWSIIQKISWLFYFSLFDGRRWQANIYIRLAKQDDDPHCRKHRNVEINIGYGRLWVWSSGYERIVWSIWYDYETARFFGHHPSLPSKQASNISRRHKPSRLRARGNFIFYTSIDATKSFCYCLFIVEKVVSTVIPGSSESM